jgi:glycosyltransferase involved in cell wall biosynthesis
MFVAYFHYLYGQDTALHHVRQFAEGARALGHRVDVHALNLAPPVGSNGAISLKATLRQALKKRFSRWLHDPKELLWNARYYRREKSILERERPDVVLVRSQGLTFATVPLAQKLNLPLVFEVNAPADEVRYFEHYRHWQRPRAWVGAYKLRRADGLVVVSGALKELYRDRYDLPAEKIDVVPNGADLALFRPETEPDAEFPRAEDAPRLGYVGSFQAWHALDLLGRLVEDIGRERPQTRFLMVGSGQGVDLLRSQTTLPAERLAFTGRVEHSRVPGLVASLDIGILAEAAPYQCPLKVVEWMAAGKAIVAPDYPPLRELIDPGVHGVLFPPGDFAAARRAVIALVDDPARRAALGQAAAVKARRELSWQDNARRVIAACERAIARRESRS